MDRQLLLTRASTILLVTFVLYEVAFNSWMPTESVLAQTSIAVLRYSLLISMLITIDLNKVFSSVFLGYWTAQILMYVVNAVLYPDWEKWKGNFNEYPIERMIYISAFVFGAYIIYGRSRKYGRDTSTTKT